MAVPARDPDALRIAYLAYRGNPHSGGQGVYTRHLTRELVGLGHEVTVYGGPPWPILDEGVGWVPVGSLNLYRDPDPFRIPWPTEFRDRYDVLEFAVLATAGFPEPLTFSLRARKMLQARRADFDLIHDNQCLGNGLLGMMEDGWPVLATLHHPITVDRDLELAHATSLRRRLGLRRWYGFLGMQMKVARAVPRVVTVSQSSCRDINAQMEVPLDRMHVVPVGVDTNRFRPLDHVARVPGRIMTTASSDVPLKGLIPLLEAIAKVRTGRDIELVVIGKLRPESRVPGVIERLGIGDIVSFVHGVSDERIVELYAEASVAVVPSLYEGFSLPAIEAMASGVPLVATTGGALPEVVGTGGDTGVLVPPNDPDALAVAIGHVLDEPDFAARIGAAGRRRVLDRFTWRKTAEGTVEHYRALLEEHRGQVRGNAGPMRAGTASNQEGRG
jgi:glycosyltransferase involved in cell wall biosynthesis